MRRMGHLFRVFGGAVVITTTMQGAGAPFVDRGGCRADGLHFRALVFAAPWALRRDWLGWATYRPCEALVVGSHGITWW